MAVNVRQPAFAPASGTKVRIVLPLPVTLMPISLALRWKASAGGVASGADSRRLPLAASMDRPTPDSTLNSRSCPSRKLTLVLVAKPLVSGL
ncbi:hypothetical protein D3C81_1138100 [compost metagenome]